jgi:alkylation response protein AidB-like acyl-CoA dehydrogenase
LADDLATTTLKDLHRPVRWEPLLQAGFLGMRLDPDQRASAIDVALVTEALGRRLCVTPFVGPVLAHELIRLAGDAPSDLAADAADGSRRVTIGLRADLSGIAGASGGLAWDAAGADEAVLLMDGALAVAPVLDTHLDAIDQTRQLANINQATPLGGVVDGDGLTRWAAFALTILSADVVGTMQGALDLAVAHARDRVQFGRPIGSFQALQHLMAEQLVSIEAARSATWHAAWTVDTLPAEESLLAARTAKAYASREAPRVAEAVLQVLGGIGQTWESTAHLYLRRGLLDRATLGDEHVHLGALATALLLPDGPLLGAQVGGPIQDHGSST